METLEEVILLLVVLFGITYCSIAGGFLFYKAAQGIGHVLGF
jgi:hypothetical protein